MHTDARRIDVALLAEPATPASQSEAMSSRLATCQSPVDAPAPRLSSDSTAKPCRTNHAFHTPTSRVASPEPCAKTTAGWGPFDAGRCNVPASVTLPLRIDTASATGSAILRASMRPPSERHATPVINPLRGSRRKSASTLTGSSGERGPRREAVAFACVVANAQAQCGCSTKTSLPAGFVHRADVEDASGGEFVAAGVVGGRCSAGSAGQGEQGGEEHRSIHDAYIRQVGEFSPDRRALRQRLPF